MAGNFCFEADAEHIIRDTGFLYYSGRGFYIEEGGEK